ncbi:hypothetical protein M1M86_01555 [Dehalococcoidales bacterium]|nr:hypothetical protein [Dehalococcoidales bacterium]
MPSKSRRQLSQRKKGKGRRSSAAKIAHQQAVTQVYKSHPEVSTSPRVTPTPARYPYIITELRRIGILAGIMLVILVVLALLLS